MPYAYCAEMGGFAFKTSTPRANDEGYKLQRLWSDDIFELRQNGGIRQLPFITQDEKMEKSKDDFVIKAMAILQVFWMVVTVIIRATRGFPISQLEVTACAFAACTFIMYILWWSKPQGVTACTDIAEKVRRVQEQSGISPWSFEKNWLPVYSIIRPFVPNLIKSQYQTQDMPIPNDSLPSKTARPLVWLVIVWGAWVWVVCS
ncbi:hypothetical protein WAI453_013215 [Rhynchosporium graminicola]|uniref:Uncharacterized protein n=1 Tax=Rhynchosporium graminicola TaxID=2792576 RepID=A0A1E1LBR8_9HELO|nr:uncharacterized protein RCO7_10628 [Rhynchosporium commune]